MAGFSWPPSGQCRLGQLVAKSTTLSSDLDICCWDGLKCNHPDHILPEDMKSSDLSRYPPPMMLGLAGAIKEISLEWVFQMHWVFQKAFDVMRLVPG